MGLTEEQNATYLSEILELWMQEPHGLLEGSRVEHTVFSCPCLLQELGEPTSHALLGEGLVIQEVWGQPRVVNQALQAGVHEARVPHVAQSTHASHCI